jgi:flavin reductase (DIM6/NTAB) family NADH-FMN oxidoreductase RutF
MFIDLTSGQPDWRALYRLCISFIQPRPIALVSTVSADGHPNLAPFSFYNMVCANPPVVMVSTGRHRDGAPKDTLVNIAHTGEFAIATVTPALAEPMVRSAAEFPPGASEWEFAGLNAAPAACIRAPLVREAPINIECRLRQLLEISDQPGGATLILGEIVAIHVADKLLGADGTVDPHKLAVVGRLGGRWYCNTANPYEMAIPPVPGGSETSSG